MAHVSERAENFAKRYVKEKEAPDNRSTDEKMAEFAIEYMPAKLKKAHSNMKSKRGK